MAFQEKKRAIATLETYVKKVSQEFTARQAGFSRVTSSVNKKIWLSLKRISSQVHCLPVKWSSQSLKRNIDQDPLRLIEQTLRSNARKRQNTCPPMKSYGVEFPHKRSRRTSAIFLTPDSEEVEEEQF